MQHRPELIQRIRHCLTQRIAAYQNSQPKLYEILLYAVMNGGKRIRPLMVYAVGESLNLSLEQLDDIACAIEFIHCYSLIHDDLPAMDNADLRRGKPSCHRAFNEASAILAGDALIPLAFETLAQMPNVPASVQITLIRKLSESIGSNGLVGGQYLDLHGMAHMQSLEEFEHLYDLKTGCLFQAALSLPAILAGSTPLQLKNINEIGKLFGRIFQLRDDINDIESTAQIQGKPANHDKNKNTFPRAVSLEKCQELYKSYLTKISQLIINTFHSSCGLLDLVTLITLDTKKEAIHE